MYCQKIKRDIIFAIFSDFNQFVAALFHALDQFELSMASYEIVLGVIGLEIHVPVKVVGKKSYSALKSDYDCSQMKHLDFLARNFVSYTAEKSFAVSFIKIYIEIHLGKILFRPRARCCNPILSNLRSRRADCPA